MSDEPTTTVKQPTAANEFIAYETYRSPGMQLVTAPIEREWMDASNNRFAYRCLPLVIANQSGWIMQCPVAFAATWNGGQQTSDLTIDFLGKAPDRRISSHFGVGVLTFAVPFLFRTPPGINLWVKGLCNHIKDGIQALEGIVETDWSPATFTMNWKMTRPGASVRFERDEPFCMLVPMPRGICESLKPRRMALADDAEVEAAHDAWRNSRAYFNSVLKTGQEAAVRQSWQKDYFRGTIEGQTPQGQHQTRLHLAEFARADNSPPVDENNR